ncbi:MAG: glycosyltransferase family 2 protein [Planctomycetaceae bacterium]|nr:glycosyltransferase family 2 protein [Planctomycetaceae bacterium]
MPDASIVIASRNRAPELMTAIESCLAQTGREIEILVYDDASTDQTAVQIAKQFPEVRMFPCQERRGLIVRRNQGFHDARSDFVFSIDDDAYFIDPETVDTALKLFEQYPTAAAIALTYLEPVSERSNGRMTAQPLGAPLRSYIGCAHVLRRKCALEVGGYRDLLVHQGEERDLCIRLLERGWSTIYGATPPLVHLQSPKRDQERVNYYGYRNTLLFSSLNAPQPYVVPRMVLDSLQLLRHRFRARTLPARLYAIAAGWLASAKLLPQRAPVSRATYRRFRSLKGHGPLEQSCEELPPPLKQNASALCSKP